MSRTPSASAGQSTPQDRQAAGFRLDAAAAVLLVGGVLLFLMMAPFRTEAYYIDWISGFFIGVMVGVSEAYLTVTNFRMRLSGSTVTLRCRRGVPEGMQNVLALLGVLLAGYTALIVLFGPVWSLDKTVLFTFNTVCGALWMIWVVYLGAMAWWAVRWRRDHGRVLRLRLTRSAT
ncbi:MAG TPA: hypothetical protein VLY45_07225 [Nitrospiria bacterium]|nr:hypothetical protein [Nitrospiria bacterium]